MQIEIRPSKLKQISLCNGSAQLEAFVRETLGYVEEDSEVSSLGTTMHDAIATIVIAAIEGKEFREDCWKKTLEREYGLNGYDSWMVLKAFFWLSDLIISEGVKWVDTLVEHHLDGADLGMPNGGTADVILILPFKKIWVIDWKFGFLEQDEAEINDQLAGYAVMGSRCFECSEVVVAIYQPRFENECTIAVYDQQSLKDSEEWVREQAVLAVQPDAALHYDYGACFYCSALGHCPEARKKVMDILEAYDLVGAETNASLCGIFKAAKIAAQMLTTVKAECKQKLTKDPASIPGLGLKAGNKKSEVPEPESLLNSLRDAGIENIFWESCKISLGEFKKMLPAEQKEMLNFIVVTGQNAPSVVVK